MSKGYGRYLRHACGLRAFCAVVQKRFNGLCRHQMTDVFIEAGDTPDDARGKSRAIITDWNGGSGKLAMAGDYTLAFRRTAKGWRIRSIACDLVPNNR